MSDSLANLSRQIDSAAELQSVVRTMKALAAANIGQYEQSVKALADYNQTVELALGVCLRTIKPSLPFAVGNQTSPPVISAVVFGSDQGLVGQFNETVTDFAIKSLAALPCKGQPQLWAVGANAYSRLADAGLAMMGRFDVPHSVKAIAPLVGQIILASENGCLSGGAAETMPDNSGELYLFYNRPMVDGAYKPSQQRLLPLDNHWCKTLASQPWPTRQLPEVLGDIAMTLPALISEYLFVSIFRACAESLASENVSRLAAMERADQNIDELLAGFHGAFHQLRQSSIDEELFDVIAGYEALAKKPKAKVGQPIERGGAQ